VAQQLLASVVCCQHLSQFWLSAPALATHAQALLLSSYVPQLRQLLMLKAGAGADASSMPLAELRRLFPGAPAAWAQGVRSIRPAAAVGTMSKLDLSTQASTAQPSASQQQSITLDSS
jgi:hypothetical protein